MSKLTKSHHNIMLAAHHFPHICINIDEYIDLALSGKEVERFIDMSLDNESISKGLYCRLFGANIWVSTIAQDGCIRVSNRDEPSAKNEKDWSPNLKIENFERLLDLKVFW